MTPARFVTILLLLSIGVSDCAAQGDDSVPVFPRILMRKLDSLVARPEVRRLTKARTAWGLFQSSPIGDIERLGDEDLMRFVSVFNEALGQVSPTTCAKVWRTLGKPQFGEAYAGVAAEVDSVSADAWTQLIVRLVWVGLRGEPVGRRATPQEVESVTQEAHTLIPADELSALGRVQARNTGTDADACFLMRSVFRSMLRLPAPRVAPVFRTMIGTE